MWVSKFRFLPKETTRTWAVLFVHHLDNSSVQASVPLYYFDHSTIHWMLPSLNPPTHPTQLNTHTCSVPWLSWSQGQCHLRWAGAWPRYCTQMGCSGWRSPLFPANATKSCVRKEQWIITSWMGYFLAKATSLSLILNTMYNYKHPFTRERTFYKTSFGSVKLKTISC